MRAVHLFAFILLIANLGRGALAADAPAKSKTPAKNPPAKNAPAQWADFVEPDFPFYSAVLDARNLGKEWPDDNLTPRGLVLNLGNDCWACFDTELLRLAVAWEGRGITPIGMAQGSYQRAGAKAPEGQEKLPHIIGTPWLANGLYPGWQTGAEPQFTDPREAGPDAKEPGRGPLPEALGRFQAVRQTGKGVCLEYEVNGTAIKEWIEAGTVNQERYIRRRFHLENVRNQMWLIVNRRPGATGKEFTRSIGIGGSPSGGVTMMSEHNQLCKVRVAPSSTPVDFEVMIGSPLALQGLKPGEPATKPPKARWPQVVTTKGQSVTTTNAYVLEDIPLPVPNAQKRNVRLSDIAFFPDGRAAGVTFDGDVWTITGLAGKLTDVRWRRFASGLHEPLSLAIRAGELYVYDRNGIWRLRDTDGNGEADVHELFSNVMAQTAETREFASGMRVAPDGSFIIAKGGQEGTTIGKHNGSVLRISPDGKTATVIGWGLRQPFVGVNPKSGLVTVSDQQGHYVPATPIHIIRDHQYYGFLPDMLPKEKYPAPIADPLTWIPHPVNASGAGQVWLTGARMGPLNDSMIHLGYNRPEIFLVRLNEHASPPQAAVLSLFADLQFAPLFGALNPADGQLYVAGFQIWGTTAKRLSGLARVRYTGAPSPLPREVVPMDTGVLVRFDLPLDKSKATDPANYSVERWNYKRTANYGSPHFKLDGSAGQEWMTPSSAYLSRDGKRVFIGIPDMKPVMQMRVGWALKTAAGVNFEDNAYFTPYTLAKFEPPAAGFEPLTVDLTPRVSQAAATPVTVQEGQRLAALMACSACHSTDGTTEGKVGPTWKGLFGKERKFKEGEPAVADDEYIRQSMLEPAVRIVAGFEKNDTGMPSYKGILTESQIQAIILYIKTLK